MSTIQEDTDIVSNLRHGEDAYIHMLFDGGGYVYRVEDMLVLFEIPLYGGKPRYMDTYHITQIDILINEVLSWS